MKKQLRTLASAVVMATMLVTLIGAIFQPASSYASGGSGGGGGGSQVDSIKVSKCYINGAGEMLIKASSSDSTARLFAYRPDGTLIGEVQNGGGSRYGGTVMPYQAYDPVYVTIVSTSGGSVTVPTTPFQI
jgi:hypothetical protein